MARTCQFTGDDGPYAEKGAVWQTGNESCGKKGVVFRSKGGEAVAESDERGEDYENRFQREPAREKEQRSADADSCRLGGNEMTGSGDAYAKVGC